ncbi:putative Ig domain-containing protein [Fodinicola acaciae]|uniref:putative Ig domain-containing protein n=1 Tax=Fodinicola acaciae TaxID=2681555 RepID=UPI001FEA595D|nr:putative Ig domain-containing protein [Fodinicola acaciae]
MRILKRALPILYGTALIVACLSAPAQAATPTGQQFSSDAVYSCNQQVKAGQNRCFAIKRTDIAPKAVSPQLLPSGYGPSNLQSAYKLPSSNTAATVAIVDAYDDPSAESDLSTYRSTYGLPACTTANGCFKKVNQNGQASPLPTGDTGWAGEISLDLDMVSAVCPSCHILLVEGNDASDNLFTAVNTAVNLGAKYVSMSWGGADASDSPTYDSQYFNHPGVVYTASSGDSGYSAGPIYPSTSQYVVSVGGTSLNTSSNSRGWTESVWSGAGSGCSVSVSKPSFQSGISACSKRADTDVSAVADPQTGVAVYQTYGGSGWAVYGGTSASAPIIASVYALAGTPGSSDRPNSYPYAHTGNLFDVTSGSNGSCSPSVLCNGTAGWDGPTGLGTPNGTAAFTAGGGGPGPLAANNPGNQTGTVGTAASLQLSASGGTSPYTWTATGLPTGLSVSSSGLISGTPSAAGTFTVNATVKDSTGATANTSFSWTINPTGGNCSGQKLGNPGFESGTSPWTATSGVISATSSSEPSHSGSYLAWLDGYGTTHTDSLSQSVAIPAGCHATLTFYLHIDSSETTTTTAYDKLTVTAGSSTLATYSNLNKASGYAQRSLDLSSLAGQTVTIKFTGTEDSSLQTSFTIDDTALTVS